MKKLLLPVFAFAVFFTASETSAQQKENKKAPVKAEAAKVEKKASTVQKEAPKEVSATVKKVTTAAAPVKANTDKIVKGKKGPGGETVYEGPQGGKYYINKKGNKIYLKN